jgi:hypothetical protein
MNSAKTQIARGVFPYVATILSLSLAVTLRIEHSCSARPEPAQTPPSPVSYFYPVF